MGGSTSFPAGKNRHAAPLKEKHIRARAFNHAELPRPSKAIHGYSAAIIESHILAARYIENAIAPSFKWIEYSVSSKRIKMPSYRLIAYLVITKNGRAVSFFYQVIAMRMTTDINPIRIGGSIGPVSYWHVRHNDYPLVVSAAK